MNSEDSIPGPAPSPDFPMVLHVDGSLGAADLVRRLHDAGLELRQGSDDVHGVLVLADEEPAPTDDGQPAREHIEAERRNLQKASAVLLALIYSLDRGLESEQASDAASVALDLIEQAIDALDIVNINRQTTSGERQGDARVDRERSGPRMRRR